MLARYISIIDIECPVKKIKSRFINFLLSPDIKEELVIYHVLYLNLPAIVAMATSDEELTVWIGGLDAQVTTEILWELFVQVSTW